MSTSLASRLIPGFVPTVGSQWAGVASSVQRGSSGVCTSSPTLAPSATGNEAPEKASCNAGVASFRLGVTWEWATVLSPEIWGQRVQLERRLVCSKCSGEVRLGNWVPGFSAVQLQGCSPTVSGSQRPRKPVSASLPSATPHWDVCPSALRGPSHKFLFQLR